jgi:hypothetical protein
MALQILVTGGAVYIDRQANVVLLESGFEVLNTAAGTLELLQEIKRSTVRNFGCSALQYSFAISYAVIRTRLSNALTHQCTDVL